MDTSETHPSLRLTRLVHACISVDDGASLLFVDPGEFGLPVNLSRADAVLVTHDHFDHISHAALRALLADRPEVRVYGPEAFGKSADFPVTVVKAGDRFRVGRIEVEVLGEWQDVANLNDAPIENVGYYIGGKILHPGDAYPRLDFRPDTALVPLAAPWSKATDLQRWLRSARPRRAVPYHDVTLNDMGIEFGRKTLSEMAKETETEVIILSPGESVRV